MNHDFLTHFNNNILALDENYLDHYAVIMDELSQVPELQSALLRKKRKLGGWSRPYQVEGGVLMIPVRGILLSQVDVQFGDWLTGYEYIADAYTAGMKDKKVKSILFDIDSPGGQVSGLKELGVTLRNHQGQKPVESIANYYALSAAYHIAAQTDRIYVMPSSYTGSVGVLSIHADRSKRMENLGVKLTMVYAGKKKIDGNPFSPLSESAQSDIQEKVDKHYANFVDDVSKGRKLDDDIVRNTEAEVYDAEESLAVGFADDIIENDQMDINMFNLFRSSEARKELREAITDVMKEDKESTGAKPTGEDSTTEQTETTTETPPNNTKGNDVDMTDNTQQVDAKQVQKSEKDRMKEVVSSEEYKGREDLANKLLFETDMEAKQIIEMLATATPSSKKSDESTETTQKGKSDFQKAMDKEAQGNIDAEEDQGDGEQQFTEQETVDAIFAAAGFGKRKAQ